MDAKKVTVKDILAMKGRQKTTMLTAYDYPMAALADKADIDMILVGDSLANVVLGLNSTTEVGMIEMIYHTKAVTRAVKNALVVADMPYESYQVEIDSCLENARRFIEEAGAQAVKLEWFEKCLEVTERIVKKKIPVVGHIGLTPQTADKIGGFKVQGKDAQAAKKLIEQAKRLEDCGCFALVLECVPDKIARIITENLKIPTIGIGAGPDCDGQVLVIHDLLGLFERFKPKFVKQYVNLSVVISEALKKYAEEVRDGIFPNEEHCFNIKEEEFKKVIGS
jgi:3-methyl-2-oxobutanoate hydroxymethyltransferase